MRKHQQIPMNSKIFSRSMDHLSMNQECGGILIFSRNSKNPLTPQPPQNTDLCLLQGFTHQSRSGVPQDSLENYEKADEDLLNSLKINPNDAYALNYLAYSWLERDYKIDEAMEMLKKAYDLKSNDPYITDSIGWAYYLIENYIEAEKYLKKAVELMPEDATVNDHYGDILWKLNRNIQARYFWNYVLGLDNADEEIKQKINIKIIEGLKNS